MRRRQLEAWSARKRTPLIGPSCSLLSAAPHLQRGGSRQKKPGRRKGGHRAPARSQQALRTDASVSAATLGPSGRTTASSADADAHVSPILLACIRNRVWSRLTPLQRTGVDEATVLGRTQSLAGLSPLHRPDDGGVAMQGRDAEPAVRPRTLDPMRASAPRPSPDAVAVRRCSLSTAVACAHMIRAGSSSAFASSRGS